MKKIMVALLIVLTCGGCDKIIEKKLLNNGCGSVPVMTNSPFEISESDYNSVTDMYLFFSNDYNHWESYIGHTLKIRGFMPEEAFMGDPNGAWWLVEDEASRYDPMSLVALVGNSEDSLWLSQHLNSELLVEGTLCPDFSRCNFDYPKLEITHLSLP